MKQRDFWSRLIAANRAGERRGIPSWCTAHPQTLSAVLAAYRDNDEPILIEATCNQVNHEGGYTGMTPADFRRFIEGLARGAGVDPDRVILGGDHLGPNPWKRLPAKEAMARASDMVKAFVEAGFAKIHLDASMACGDETRGLGRDDRRARGGALRGRRSGGARRRPRLRDWNGGANSRRRTERARRARGDQARGGASHL